MTKVTTKQAAKDLGKSIEIVRYGLRTGAYPWGTAVNRTGRKWTYIIYPDKYKRLVKGGNQ